MIEKNVFYQDGKREKGENDNQTLARELQEELGVEIDSLKYYQHYLDKAVFEEGEDFQQTTYIAKLKSYNINVKNEIKEALWIQSNYEKYGIVCNPTLKFKIIPDLIKDGYLK